VVAITGDIIEWIDAMNPYNANIHDAPGAIKFMTRTTQGIKYRIRWLDRAGMTPYAYCGETVKLYCPGEQLF